MDDKFEEKLDNLSSQLVVLKGHIEQMYAEKAENHAELTAGMNPIERAKVDVQLAYCINALFYTYQKLSGEDEQPALKEMERIKRYVKKIDTASGNVFTDESHIKLDTEAADRFIKSVIADQSARGEEKKRKLDKGKPVNSKKKK